MKYFIFPAGCLCLAAGIAQAAPNTSGNVTAPLRTVRHVDVRKLHVTLQPQEPAAP